MNASFLQELGFQILWIEWIIVTRKEKEMSQAEPSEDTLARSYSGPAGVCQQGFSEKGVGLREAISFQGKDLGVFVLGPHSCLYNWEETSTSTLTVGS